MTPEQRTQYETHQEERQGYVAVQETHQNTAEDIHQPPYGGYCALGICDENPKLICPLHHDHALNIVKEELPRLQETLERNQSRPTREMARQMTQEALERDQSMRDHPAGTGIKKEESKMSKPKFSNEFIERTAKESTGLWSDDLEKEAGIAGWLADNVIPFVDGPQETEEAAATEVANDKAAVAQWQKGKAPSTPNASTAVIDSMFEEQKTSSVLPEWIQGALDKEAHFPGPLTPPDDSEPYEAEDSRLEAGRDATTQPEPASYDDAWAQGAYDPVSEESFTADELKPEPMPQCGDCNEDLDMHCSTCDACPGDQSHKMGEACPFGDDYTGDHEDDYDYDDSMDGDFDSAMASAGHGTDEDYGFYGDSNEEY
jgi:hypothetical protein